MKFFYQARGSAFESIHWLEKAKVRKLVADKEYVEIKDLLDQLPKEINYLIANTAKNLKK
ncbi:MAG: hypothetical protein UT23_C0004G0124 [Candidatus Woesebacteria bacterium GW2011_GWA1_39_12]|uniref:Four helix bundle protein n=1 Tax=Candidatus Woesebacteria bacterium GW2011_GWA1_39_12 TaxID=1618549 RepID=A0A0G0M265_9BACT|nr:MAG: hypothetical protein UT23_C0004G0124 [Candidatus Woesebacteria bacterium GW2011_GWA1_39_12]